MKDIDFRWAWLFYQVAVGIGTVVLVVRFWIFCSRIEGAVKLLIDKFLQ
jgi:hypothetical protein